MTSHLDDRPVETRPAHVALEPQTDTVHLMMPMHGDIELFGISVCGYPSEYLTVLPDLAWSGVAASRRCPHCDDTG